MIKETDRQLCLKALEMARRHGAANSRVNLVVSRENLVASLNGELDKVTGCLDKSMNISLFVDGRFGSFSTDKLEESSLDEFISKAAEMVRMLAADPCRALPATQRCCSTAVTGNELDLLDTDYDTITAEKRKSIALEASVFGQEFPGDFELISEEAEYSDSICETLLMDSNGLECRHSENSFDYGTEVTIESHGQKYSGYWWDSTSRLSLLDWKSCGRRAVFRAAEQINSAAIRSGKYNMLVDSEVASRMISPVLNALNAYSLQQNNSFLIGSLGRQIFHEGMTLTDRPHIKGSNCSKLFDSEGVATSEGFVIEAGVVKKYFVNEYMSRKMGTEPTIEEATRPALNPWPVPGLDRDSLMKRMGDGILVTDFNGGNCNSATGDFSYGIEGLYFKNGKVLKPVSGMIVTGNFIRLWNSLEAVADDARPCMSKLIPTLAFRKVDFSG